MKSPFEKFIVKIISQIDGTDEEKADIYEEMLIHLELTCNKFIEEGFTKTEAAQLAMESFGDSKTIGNEMQEAMFPLRKLFLLLLSVLSIFYSIFAYLVHLISDGDAEIIWLILSIATSSVLLLFALQVFPSIDRKRWINTALICHVFIYLLGVLLAANTSHTISSFLSFIAISILLFTIFLIYRTTIIDYHYHLSTFAKHVKWLHFLNISAGIAVTALTLFFLWAILLFSESIPPSMLWIFIPLSVWLIAYFIQFRFIKKNKNKIAFVLAIIPFLILIIALLFLIWSVFPIGVLFS